MKHLSVIFAMWVLVLAVIGLSNCAPLESTSLTSGSSGKSAFGQPFDEIVVESTLNVKRKVNGRQSRGSQPSSLRVKRQNGFPFPSFQFPKFQTFGGSAADASAQAQSHEADSPFGKFGASAAGGQSQSLAFGPNGPVGSASFSGSQQYKLPNGQTLNIAFGNSVGASNSNNAGGATIAVNGPSR
ncbi:uncharacterized protein LOC143193567 [Rhynchophorus ferrugineus]|uniref:Uncharacterized protein n=1 Tax=Rhynchophorus ferrugineus TaxID=354439 RepID=A0A834IRD5_RHYFE|nr:hypothetical protein GWI33_023276 [Rhynchophorus ferrugineus]